MNLTNLIGHDVLDKTQRESYSPVYPGVIREDMFINAQLTPLASSVKERSGEGC